MKHKITFLMLALLLTGFYSFAQEEEEIGEKFDSHVMIGANGSDGIGFFMHLEKIKPFDIEENRSVYFKAIAIYDVGVSGSFNQYKGKGSSLALGSRTYFSKSKPGYGFFSSNELKYSTIKFKDSDYTGTYSYFSFFTPEMGWKFMFGKSKRIGLEVSGGVEWAIEIKGKGDVDNRSFDVWKPKLNLGFVYAFE